MKTLVLTATALVLAGLLAPAARAEVVTDLTGDFGCSLQTLGAGAVAADSQPDVPWAYLPVR